MPSRTRSALVVASFSILSAPLALALTKAPSPAASGNTCTWQGPSNGAWSAPANWTCTPGGTVPGAGDTAVFPAFSSPDAGTPVEISGSQAVGTLDVNAAGYTFASSNDGGLTIGTAASFNGHFGPSDYLTVPVTIGSAVTLTTSTDHSAFTGPIAFTAASPLTLQGNFELQGPLSGPGRLVMATGNANISSVNTYAGGTQLLSGEVTASNAGAFGSGPVAVVGTGQLNLVPGGATFPNALSIGSHSTPTPTLWFLDEGPFATSTWSGPIDLVGPATIHGGIVLSGPITSSTSGAVLTLVADSAVNVGNGYLPIELANPKSSYDGGTIVASPSSPGAVVADYASSFGTGPLTILGQTANSNVGIVEIASGVALPNAITAPGGMLLARGNASTTGPVTGTGYSLGVATDGGTLEVAGTLSGSANSNGIGVYFFGPFFLNGGSPTGTVLLNLASPATYEGKTGIVNATLDLGSKENPLPPSTQVTFMSASGTVVPPSVLAVHAAAKIGSLTGGLYASEITLDHGAILTIASGDPAIVEQDFSGSITGDGGVTFTGDGGNRFPTSSTDAGVSLNLADFNYAYTGPTRVEGNPATLPTTLALYVSDFGVMANGSIPNSTITVAGGGELDLGAASVVGPIVGDGGTIVPYPGPATSPDAGAVSLTLSAGTRFVVHYAGPNGDAGTTSFLAVNGSVSLGGASLVATSDAPPVPQGPVVVLSNRSDAGVAGTFAGLPEGATLSLGDAGMLKISYAGGDGNDVTLEVPLVDAGADAGPMDAAVDATVSDAGLADAGADGNGPSAPDANAPDATLVADAAAPDASAVDSSAGDDEGASATSSGCSCDVVRRDANAPGGFLTAGLALLALRRRRRAAAAPR